jgi:glycosyltransferase involved in cell wall biosynthesis
LKVLLIAPRYPWPPRRGDQLRALQAARSLAPEHDLTLLVPAPPAAAPAPEAGVGRVLTYRLAALAPAAGMATALFGGTPWQNALFRQPDLGRRLRRLAAGFDLVILQLVRLAGHLPDLGGAPLLVDLIDSLSLNLERRAAVDHRWLRPLLVAEARRVARAEGRLLGRARLATVVCARDRDHLAARLPPALAGRLAVLPLAVTAAGGPPPQAPPRLVMTGNLGYFPNADGARWLLAEVWPELRRRLPEARLVLAGDRPPRRLAAAARRAGAGLVAAPADLGAVLAGATAALAPMRCGSGLPIKVLEAWSRGVPVVASPWAAAGTTGEPGRDLLVAGGAQEWVAAVAELLANPETARRLADAGGRRLAADYGPDEVRRGWLAAVESAAGGGGS